MDDHRFDDLIRSLTGSRRSLLAGALTTPMGWLVLPGAGARKKPKDKPKPKPNQYGCLDVGDPCKRAGQCCSSLCKGKPGKKTCRAHDESICTPRKDFCSWGTAAFCNLSKGAAAVCLLTTGKAGFCGDTTDGTEQHCRRCSRDADCEEVAGPGAACVDMTVGICKGACAETGGTACIPSGLRSAAPTSASHRGAGH